MVPEAGIGSVAEDILAAAAGIADNIPPAAAAAGEPGIHMAELQEADIAVAVGAGTRDMDSADKLLLPELGDRLAVDHPTARAGEGGNILEALLVVGEDTSGSVEDMWGLEADKLGLQGDIDIAPVAEERGVVDIAPGPEHGVRRCWGGREWVLIQAGIVELEEEELEEQ